MPTIEYPDDPDRAAVTGVGRQKAVERAYQEANETTVEVRDNTGDLLVRYEKRDEPLEFRRVRRSGGRRR